MDILTYKYDTVEIGSATVSDVKRATQSTSASGVDDASNNLVPYVTTFMILMTVTPEPTREASPMVCSGGVYTSSAVLIHIFLESTGQI